VFLPNSFLLFSISGIMREFKEIKSLLTEINRGSDDTGSVELALPLESMADVNAINLQLKSAGALKCLVCMTTGLFIYCACYIMSDYIYTAVSQALPTIHN